MFYALKLICLESFPEGILYCDHLGFVNFGGLRTAQISRITRRPILHQYGRRGILERWVVMMAAKIHKT